MIEMIPIELNQLILKDIDSKAFVIVNSDQSLFIICSNRVSSFEKWEIPCFIHTAKP